MVSCRGWSAESTSSKETSIIGLTSSIRPASSSSDIFISTQRATHRQPPRCWLLLLHGVLRDAFRTFLRQLSVDLQRFLVFPLGFLHPVPAAIQNPQIVEC